MEIRELLERKYVPLLVRSLHDKSVGKNKLGVRHIVANKRLRAICTVANAS